MFVITPAIRVCFQMVITLTEIALINKIKTQQVVTVRYETDNLREDQFPPPPL